MHDRIFRIFFTNYLRKTFGRLDLCVRRQFAPFKWNIFHVSGKEFENNGCMRKDFEFWRWPCNVTLTMCIIFFLCFDEINCTEPITCVYWDDIDTLLTRSRTNQKQSIWIFYHKKITYLRNIMFQPFSGSPFL